jgi:hypothetical protein
LGSAGLYLGYISSTLFMTFRGITAIFADADNAQAVTHDSEQEDFVVCKHCNSTLGTSDDVSNGWRIWKWNIDIQSSVYSQPTSPIYSTQKWISARLLYLIENLGIRKFHIHPAPRSSAASVDPNVASEGDAPPPTPSLLVWVFTPDLLFSSSIPVTGRNDPTRAMKVFYQQKTWQPLEPGEPESASIEDVEFPEELFCELRNILGESQRVLPPTARKFQGWEVGLLERFEVRDLRLAQLSEHNNSTSNEVDVTIDL